MMSMTAYSSQVPASVIHRVLSEAWSSSLTTAERITLMTSSPLVNKQWASIFAFISHQDIHVPTTSYFVQKLHPMLSGRVQSHPNLHALCRSISVVLEYATVSSIGALPGVAITLPTTISIPGFADEPPMGHTLRALLATLSENSCPLPHLRTISIEFVNIGLDDVFVNDRFFRFPAQVTDLEFTFTHSPLVATSNVDAIRANQAQHDFSHPVGLSARMDQSFHGGEITPCFPSVRCLRILGGSEATIADTVSQCPELDTLEVDVSGKPHSSLISTHLVSLYDLSESFALPALAIKSGPSDMAPSVWDGVYVDSFSGLRQFCRPAPVVTHRRTHRFMSKAAKPFSKLFSSRRKSISSH